MFEDSRYNKRCVKISEDTVIEYLSKKIVQISKSIEIKSVKLVLTVGKSGDKTLNIMGLSHPLYLSIEHHSDEVYVVSGDPCGIEYLQKKGIILEAKEGDKALARKFGCPLGDVFKVNFIKELPLDLRWNQIPEADKIIQVLLQTS